MARDREHVAAASRARFTPDRCREAVANAGPVEVARRFFNSIETALKDLRGVRGVVHNAHATRELGGAAMKSAIDAASFVTWMKPLP